MDEDDAVVEEESDAEAEKSRKANNPDDPVIKKQKENQKILLAFKDLNDPDAQRYNGMQFIPAGTFTMGTDEMITRDGEGPARQ